MNVAVLVSGSGTNLQAVLDRCHGRGSPPVRVSAVIGSREGIGALERARQAGVPWEVLAHSEDPNEEARALMAALERAQADLVVLAGYLRRVPAAVVGAYAGRIINIHPALLPSFGGEGMYGRHVHRAVIESGARVTGVTVHFVDEEYDRGPIIAQWPVPVLEDDDPERLAARVLRTEHRVLPEVVSAFARGEVELGPDGRCRWKRPWFTGETFRLEGAE